MSALCQSTIYNEPSGANSKSTGLKFRSSDVSKSCLNLNLYPVPSSKISCCLVPKNPIVLFTKISP